MQTNILLSRVSSLFGVTSLIKKVDKIHPEFQKKLKFYNNEHHEKSKKIKLFPKNDLKTVFIFNFSRIKILGALLTSCRKCQIFCY